MSIYGPSPRRRVIRAVWLMVALALLVYVVYTLATLTLFHPPAPDFTL